MDFKSYKFNFILTGILALLAIPTVFHVSQWIETRYFPVIDNFRITQVEISPDGYPILSGSIERKRQCVLQDVIFVNRFTSFDSPIGSAVPEVANPSRPPGLYSFGPWILYTDLQTLQTQASIRAIYDCHPFYKTVTYIPLSGALPNGQE